MRRFFIEIKGYVYSYNIYYVKYKRDFRERINKGLPLNKIKIKLNY